MKIGIALIVILAPTASFAQSRVAVPTGIDVKGCTRYIATYSGRAVCGNWRRHTVDTGNPQADVNSTGD